VFNGKVNYVIKRNMFATGSENNPTTYTTDTAGSWKFDSYGTAVTNLRNWEIRRLTSTN